MNNKYLIILLLLFFFFDLRSQNTIPCINVNLELSSTIVDSNTILSCYSNIFICNCGKKNIEIPVKPIYGYKDELFTHFYFNFLKLDEKDSSYKDFQPQKIDHQSIPLIKKDTLQLGVCKNYVLNIGELNTLPSSSHYKVQIVYSYYSNPKTKPIEFFSNWKDLEIR